VYNAGNASATVTRIVLVIDNHSTGMLSAENGLPDLQNISFWDNWETFVHDFNEYDQSMADPDWM